ncbi:MAG: regulatory protein RecX [Bacteroidales bacterium]
MAENMLYDIALKKAMALCAGREMCRHDISAKLSSWGVKEEDSSRIISVLVSEKFIDEERYANAFVKDRFRYNRWGRVKIAAGLKAKHIQPELIKEALAVIDDDVYISSLKEMLAGHRRKVKAKNQYDLKGKMMRFGLSRGFESSLLYDILNDLD